MKFIIKICDERGNELARHKVCAEPHYSRIDEMVYFDFQSIYFVTTKEVFDYFMAERKEE